MLVSEVPPTDMFEFLRPYRYVLLTGPHRSGTTIAARMIANDLGIHYYEEEDVAHRYRMVDPEEIDLRDFFEAVDEEPLVLRCPSLCHTVHTYADVPNLAVVMVMRPVAEIRASQERVRWGFGGEQMGHYPGYDPPVAGAKYAYWADVQEKALGDRAYRLHYDGLARYPLWVPKAQRAEFHVRQWKVGDERGSRYQLTPEEYDRIRQF